MTLAALLPMVHAAYGQPVDPYAPAAPAAPKAPASPDASPRAPKAPPPVAPSPSPAGAPNPAPASPSPADDQAPQDPYAQVPAVPDPVLAERVASALVVRAQELLDARVFLDAKQLAVEALVRSPRGASAERARAIIHAVNVQLGIPEDAPRAARTAGEPAAAPDEVVDMSPIGAPPEPEQPAAAPEYRTWRDRIPVRVHSGLYTGLLGTTLGAFLSDDSPEQGAIPVGIVAGLAGAYALPKLVDRLGWTDGQVRVVGSASAWGGMVGGLVADVAKTEDTSAREVLVGASIGSTVVGAGGYLLSRVFDWKPRHVAVMDTVAGIGAVGGLTLGMVMQPAETEAYSLNAMLGIAGGLVAGTYLGQRGGISSRSARKIGGAAALGAAAPFLLYALIYDSHSSADERITGGLSTAGLLAGAYLAWRFTRSSDITPEGGGEPGSETAGRGARETEAPVAIVGRSSAGRWGLGGIALSPLSRALAPQPGMALQVFGAAF